MAHKRHHYLPQFLLRRFAIPGGDGAGLVWRADLSRTRVLRVAPKHEAAKRHYYHLPPESGLPPAFAEEVLARIEGMAAAAITKFERAGHLELGDRHALALFILLQHRRTPAGRRQLRFADELAAKLDAEMRISNQEMVRRVLEQNGASVSDEDVERWQEQTLDDLRSGELVIESTPEREVALMFNGLDQLAPKLVEEFDWRFLTVPPDVAEVALPDVGLTMFDPTPPFPTAGTGFASSAASETVVHLGPRLVVILMPGEGGGYLRVATADDVESINLRAYASSDVCLYGRSEQVVRSVRALAEADSDRVERLRPRPPAIWIAEVPGEPTGGVLEFTGYSVGGTVTQELHVSREAVEDARNHAISYGG